MKKFAIRNDDTITEFWLQSDKDGDIHLMAKLGGAIDSVLWIDGKGRLNLSSHLPQSLGLSLDENGRIKLGEHND